MRFIIRNNELVWQYSDDFGNWFDLTTEQRQDPTQVNAGSAEIEVTVVPWRPEALEIPL